MNHTKALARASAVIAAIIVIVSGVTFAALQSQLGIVQGNTIQTAIASLQVSKDGTSYSNSTNGYFFGGLVPGGSPSPTSGYPIYVRNVGTAALALRLSVKGPIVNSDNVDLAKVHVIITPTSGGVPQNFILADLITSSSTGGAALTAGGERLSINATNSYMLQISLEADAITGPSATLSAVDFSFGGAATN